MATIETRLSRRRGAPRTSVYPFPMSRSGQKHLSVEPRRVWQRLARSGALGICSMAVGLLCASPSLAQSDEKEIKAAFVLSVAEFVTWPDTEFAGPDAPLVVGLLGDLAFDTQLEEVSPRTSAQGRPVRVRRLQPGEPVDGCHILVFGAIGRDEMEHTLAQVRGSAVLTLAELDDFAQRGGIMHIRFERNPVAGNRHSDIGIRFGINLAASERAGLEISSRLLQVATLVDDALDDQ